MDLRALRYFVSVAEDRGFSRAAQRLGISQSALSRQIQQLEAELKLRLFDRIGRRISLTPTGEELLVRSYAVLRDADSLHSRAKQLAGGSSGILTIGATPQTLESLVAKVLPLFLRKFREVEVRLIEDGAAGLLDKVDKGLADVVISALTHDRALAGRALFPLGVLAAMPPRHRLRARRAIEVTDLAAEPMLLLRPQFLTRQLFDGACQIAQIRPRVLIESASPHSLLALVEAGQGVAIIPSTLRLAGGGRHVVALRQGGRQLGLWMSAIWDPKRYVSPAAMAFVDELHGYTRRDYPGRSLRLGRLVETITAPLRPTPA